MKSFNLRLSKLIKSKRSHLCVGLDMNPEAMGSSNTTLDELKKHAFKVIDATSDLSSAFKPNLAFFERWGSEGFKWLEELMDYFPDDLNILLKLYFLCIQSFYLHFEYNRNYYSYVC